MEHAHPKHPKIKSISRRLSIIIGQLHGLERMLDEGAYCVDVLTQTTAVKKAISSCEDVILENHLATCVVQQMQGKERNKAIAEVMKVYKLSKKDN